jgi:hypothetical protein
VYQGVQNPQSATPKILDVQIPMEAFAHTNPSAVVRLEASLADGTALPSWISFDPNSGSLHGVPPSADAAATVEIKITARDDAGRVAEVIFHPIINTSTDAASATGGAPTAPSAGAAATSTGRDDAAATSSKLISGGLTVPAGVDAASVVKPGDTGATGANLKLAAAGESVANGPASGPGFPVAQVDAGVFVPASIGAADTHLFVYHGMSDLSFSGRGTINFAVPMDAFAHSDANATVQLEAQLADGKPLPSWLSFSAETGSFFGRAPAGETNHYDIEIVARDKDGRIARVQFGLDLDTAPDTQSMPVEKSEAEDGSTAVAVKLYDKPGEKPGEKTGEKSKESGKDASRVAERVSDRDAVKQAKAQLEKIKSGAMSFTEQAHSVKIARDPILAKILSSIPAEKGRDPAQT